MTACFLLCLLQSGFKSGFNGEKGEGLCSATICGAFREMLQGFSPATNSVEVPVVHRGDVQLCAYGSQEPFVSLTSSMWFISSSVGKKKFCHAFLERLLGPDLL